MTHFAEDVQFFLILAGGGSLTALSISRVKYSKDWFSPWFTMTKVTSFLALVVIAVNEREAIHHWWYGAPILVSGLILSILGFGLIIWLRRRGMQRSYIDLGLGGNEGAPKGKRRLLSWPFAFWGIVNLVVLLYSLVR